MLKENSSKKIILTNILSGLISQSITIIYGFIIPILLIKEFGSKINGIVSSISQFIAYINLLQFGIGPIIKNALFKPIANNDKKQISEILGASFKFFKKIAFALIAYIFILCIIFPIINKEYSTLFSISLIIIISLGTFFEYFFGMTYNLYLSSSQKNYVVDFVNIFGYITSIIMIYILIKLNSCIQIVKLIGSVVFIIKPLLIKIYYDKKIGIKIEKNSLYVFKNKWNGFTHHIAATIQSNTDVVILTIFNTFEAVSVYSVYNLIIVGIRSVIISLTNGIDGYFGKILVNDSASVNKKFSLYNFFFYTITTILIGCTLVLITPFVSVYTKNITDANYIQNTFGYILVIAEFNFAIRYPYSTLVYSKGLFKETSKYAIIEPIINIIVSIVLVKKIGLVGVAIGTMISMPIRSFGFIYCGIKNILKDKFSKHLKIILVSYVELGIIFYLKRTLLFIDVYNYFNWLILAFIVFFIISVFVIATNLILCGNVFRRKYE